jgi:hypothetical protein
MKREKCYASSVAEIQKEISVGISQGFCITMFWILAL